MLSFDSTMNTVTNEPFWNQYLKEGTANHVQPTILILKYLK